MLREQILVNGVYSELKTNTVKYVSGENQVLSIFYNKEVYL